MIGDANVGKTHMLYSFIEKQIPKNLLPTIGVEFILKNTVMKDGSVIRVQIWDTGSNFGWESWTRKIQFDCQRVRNYSNSHYHGTRGFIIVYDTTDLKSFESVNFWLEQVKEYCDKYPIPGILIGNQIDKIKEEPESRQVGKFIAQEFAKMNNMLFEEVSALTGEKVKESFESLFNGWVFLDSEIYEKQFSLTESVLYEENFDLEMKKKSLNEECCHF